MVSLKCFSLRLNKLLNTLLFIFNGEYMVETTVIKTKTELVLRCPDI